RSTSAISSDACIEASRTETRSSAVRRRSRRATVSGPARRIRGSTTARSQLRPVVIPSLPEQTGRPEPFPKCPLLLVAEDIRIADLHRQVLAVRVLLEVRGQREALDEV